MKHYVLRITTKALCRTLSLQLEDENCTSVSEESPDDTSR